MRAGGNYESLCLAAALKKPIEIFLRKMVSNIKKMVNTSYGHKIIETLGLFERIEF
jgi:hypothetical protein